MDQYSLQDSGCWAGAASAPLALRAPLRRSCVQGTGGPALFRDTARVCWESTRLEQAGPEGRAGLPSPDPPERGRGAGTRQGCAEILLNSAFPMCLLSEAQWGLEALEGCLVRSHESESCHCRPLEGQ